MTEIDVDELVHELKELKLRVARLEQHRQTTKDAQTGNKNTLAVGDRIRIKNKVKKPQNWPADKEWTESKERSATITKVTDKQVHFITDNGNHTWRAPHNLKKNN
jgi:dsDNA-specific endonuclease/ATPase MutS2